MLKRRILASSMASVMALSSVAAVAFAEDTKTITKADLQKYLESMEEFRDTAASEYGDDYATQFDTAYEQALSIAEDDDATAEEIAAAYALVEGVYNAKVQKTAKELQLLIDENKAVYDKGNIFNEEIGDTIYDITDWDDFESAYDEATSVVDGEDPVAITEAWKALNDAAKMEPLKAISKAQFASAYNAYDKMIAKLNNHEEWRRGTCKVDATTSTTDDNDDDLVLLTKLKDDDDYNLDVTFGDLAEIVRGTSTPDWLEDGGKYINYTVGDSVEAFINQEYEWFTEDVQNINKTTDEDLIAAYDACLDAVAVFNGWKVDSTKQGSEAMCEKLLKQYHDQLALTFKSADVQDVLELKVFNSGVKGTVDNIDEYHIDECTAPANATLKVDADGYIKLSGSDDGEMAAGDGTVTVRKGENILKYIKVTGADIKTVAEDNDLTGYVYGDDDTNQKELSEAIIFYEKYAAEAAKSGGATWTTAWDTQDSTTGNNTKLSELDTLGTVVTAEGNTAEWTVIYRYLKYQLEDAFGDAEKSSREHTRSEVSSLLTKSRALVEETIEVTSFHEANVALAEINSCAEEWLREAKAMKGYKDGVAVTYRTDAKYFFGASNYVIGTTETSVTAGTAGAAADAVYKDLKKVYDALDEMNKAMPTTFGEMFNKLGEIRLAKVAGTVAADNKALNDAMDEFAVQISAFNEEAPATVGGYAFWGYEFQPFERLQTAKVSGTNPNKAEKNLLAAYNAMVEAYEAAQKADGLDYDVDGNKTNNIDDVTALLDKINASMADGAAPVDMKYNFDGTGNVDVNDVMALLDWQNANLF